MKKLRYNDLVAYAGSFVSFVLPKIDVDEVILFGSVARGEADEESDVDLFFNVKGKNNFKVVIKRELERFYKSKVAGVWSLKGVKNFIRFEVGELDKWKLRRSVISDGIVLYGKYRGAPEKMEGFVFFNLKPIRDIAKRNRILRKLFGRKEKSYFVDGVVDGMSGKRLSPTSFVVPIGRSQEILGMLNSEKLDFSFFEFWSDGV